MAWADPQSFDFGAGAVSFNRISAGINSGAFQLLDGTKKFTVSHAYGKRVRRVARLDWRKIAPDPLQPATNVPYTMSCYVVLDVPVDGFSVAEQKALWTGLYGNLNASTGANFDKFDSGQS
jgi:hypothetical protein